MMMLLQRCPPLHSGRGTASCAVTQRVTSMRAVATHAALPLWRRCHSPRSLLCCSLFVGPIH